VLIRVGIEIPKVEVRFEDLFVEGDAFNGSRALPTLVNSTMNAMEVYVSFFPSSLISLFLVLMLTKNHPHGYILKKNSTSYVITNSVLCCLFIFYK